MDKFHFGPVGGGQWGNCKLWECGWQTISKQARLVCPGTDGCLLFSPDWCPGPSLPLLAPRPAVVPNLWGWLQRCCTALVNFYQMQWQRGVDKKIIANSPQLNIFGRKIKIISSSCVLMVKCCREWKSARIPHAASAQERLLHFKDTKPRAHGKFMLGHADNNDMVLHQQTCPQLKY